MNIEKQIEFDKVKNIWANLAVTTSAKQKIITKKNNTCIPLQLRKKMLKTIAKVV